MLDISSHTIALSQGIRGRAKSGHWTHNTTKESVLRANVLPDRGRSLGSPNVMIIGTREEDTVGEKTDALAPLAQRTPGVFVRTAFRELT